MTRPMYKTELIPPIYSPQESNSGLWYDKFCDQWSEGWDGLGDEGKKNWITSAAKGVVGEQHIIKELADRRLNLLRSCKGELLYFRTERPFVTGLGRNHPVENGFAWHHVLGTPYLPGSSIKGMVRSWATSWEDWPSEVQKSNEIDRIFGPRESKSNSVGSVIFLDAIPIRPVQLKGDIMTPHYAPYYQKNELPADWHSPMPIPFLVVALNQEFLFGIMPRKPMDDLKDCSKAKHWLVQALEYIGAGAKTAVGYGRFKQFEPELQKSGAMEWLESLAKPKTISVEDLAKSSKVLAENWANIEDKKFKKEVFKEIKAIYQKMNWWDEAPSRGTRRIISEYYKAWEAGNP